MSQLFGGLLLGVGILIMTCSGLCSLAVVAMGAGMVFEEPSVLLLPLLVGGIPFAIGFGMFRWGKWLLRQAHNREP
ncbi:hypothetical protein Q9Q95_10545 [Sphingomonas sp. DG1-23]|uniref:hypothetical protein n=1 Tax=Sphingomonas sp. DG1-23 TaxID=3068316 RepID=UPI00273F9C29|nr:hypothetical protein [Sphingomonas sp. DG1-23]MDP5279360.1 hypothetical protein [Sphingomonas sp. DG1-23]